MATRGAVGVADIFKFASDHSAIKKKSADEAAAALTDRFIRIGSMAADGNISEQTDLTPGTKKTTMKIAHILFGESFTEFKKFFRPSIASEASDAPPEIKSEFGLTYGGVTASGSPLAWIISYREYTDTKVLVWMGCGAFLENLGGRQSKGGEYAKPTTEFETTPLNKSGGLTVAQALFDSAIVTVGSGGIVVPKGSWEHEEWVTRAF